MGAPIRVAAAGLVLCLAVPGEAAEPLGAGGAARVAVPPVWRQPAGIWLDPEGRFAYLACRRTAELLVVDIESEAVVGRLSIGGWPESLAGAADGTLVIPDSQRNLLHVLGSRGAALFGHRTLPTGDQPMQAALGRDGRRAWVSLRMDRAVECFDLEPERRRFHAALDFAPHCLALDPSERFLLAADAFRGTIAVLDAASGTVLRQFPFPGTNIRGLAVDSRGEFLLFTHQILSEKSMITRDAVFWGALMTNNLRRVPLTSLLDPSRDPLRESNLHFLGDATRGAGDPGALAITGDQELVVCLAGVDEIGIDQEWPYSFQRVPVGKRPTAVVIDRARRRALVVNTHGDSISRVDLARRRVERTIVLGPAAERGAAERGEVLFHDARLSLDGWYSCQSCHTDGHTNGSNADTLGDENYGAPKNTPTLLGVAATGPWAWTGRFDRLEDQIASSIRHSMQGGIPTDGELADLAAFLRTLPPRPRASADESVERGRLIFAERGCSRCHREPEYTTPDTYDVGLDDGLAGHTRFNPPSLRGVGSSAPYFHDGRAATLPDVFTAHGHQLRSPIAEPDLAALVRFLESL